MMRTKQNEYIARLTAKIEELKETYGIKAVYCGTGNPTPKPHIAYRHNPAGADIVVYPQGDGYLMPGYRYHVPHPAGNTGMYAELTCQAQVTTDLLRCELNATSLRSEQRRTRLQRVIALADQRLVRRAEAARQRLNYYN